MHRANVLFGFLTGIAAAAGFTTLVHGQPAATIEGVWTLNRSLSESPREIGFTPVWAAAPPDSGQSGSTSGGGGRGRRGSGGGGGVRGASGARPESYEDAQRRDALVAEARNPPARLTIVDTPSAITITNELGQSRTFHPDLREESIQIDHASVPATTTRDANRLLVVYHAGSNREVRYTYTRSATPPQLIVDIQFLDHGAGDKARRVYEPGTGTEPATATTSSTTTSSAPPPAGGASPAAAGGVDQRPGAELKGLNRVGVLVEDLGDQAAACGLRRDAIETAVSKQLSDSGFTVRRNSDDDTYLYINVMTASVSNGTCLSRYDAFLYTHATTKLSYHDRPVLVQVLLMHRGGMGSSAAAAHPASVARGLEDFVGVFIEQIRSANK
jgi:hypothetical protein